MVEHARGGHAALVGAPKAGGEHRLAAQALGPGAREHALEAGEGLRDGAVDVAAVVGLRDGDDHVYLVKAGAVAQRALEAALVGDQHAHRNPGGDVDPLQHLGGVGELGEHVGAHEARDLEARQPGARERVDQLHLALGGDHVGLVLEAVARADLPDPHRPGQAHHIERPPLTPSVSPVM